MAVILTAKWPLYLSDLYFILKGPLIDIKMTGISQILGDGHFEQTKMTVNPENSSLKIIIKMVVNLDQFNRYTSKAHGHFWPYNDHFDGKLTVIGQI